jgi:2-dehydro-3-deoxyphosphogluconate aldolase / (4S)-4-hydroxy-2-oxoglutarate aldolase
VLLVLRLPVPDAVWLAGVAADRGVRCFEVTATQPDFRVAFGELRNQLPRAELGVGSLRTTAEIQAAADLGAAFAVSPVAVEDGARAAHEAGIAFVEGAATPTEIHQADRRGADLVKLFPARALGGPSYVRDVLAPLPHVRIMASGGVAPGDARAYLEAGATAVALGTSIARPEELSRRDPEPILARLDALALA